MYNIVHFVMSPAAGVRATEEKQAELGEAHGERLVAARPQRRVLGACHGARHYGRLCRHMAFSSFFFEGL